ncbi:MAG: hypothetical protein AAB904_02100, partial [Patescibacteria group bacterium]
KLLGEEGSALKNITVKVGEKKALGGYPEPVKSFSLPMLWHLNVRVFNLDELVAFGSGLSRLQAGWCAR